MTREDFMRVAGSHWSALVGRRSDPITLEHAFATLAGVPFESIHIHPTWDRVLEAYPTVLDMSVEDFDAFLCAYLGLSQ